LLFLFFVSISIPLVVSVFIKPIYAATTTLYPYRRRRRCCCRHRHRCRNQELGVYCDMVGDCSSQNSETHAFWSVQSDSDTAERQ
jgi:hypothetical protein